MRSRLLSRQVVMALALVACFVGLVFLFLGDSSERSRDEDPGLQVENAAAGSAAAAEENGGPEKAIETEPFFERPRAEEASVGVRLDVVAKDGGQPLPGASIVVVDHQAWMAAGTRYRESGEPAPEDLRERFTTRLTSDAAGAVSLPVFAGQLKIEGQLGALWGSMWVRGPSDEALVLMLERDRELRVRVVDAHDQPREGVPIVTRRPNKRGSGFRRGRLVKTDAEGLALLSHVQIEWPKSDDWAVTCGFPLIDAPAIPVSWETPPGEELNLEMPETGSLRVQCLDLEGRPVFDTASLQLTAHAGDPERFPELWPPALEGYARPNEQHEVVLPFVGLGLQFRGELTAHDPSLGLRPAVEVAAGPVEPGETATMTVILGKDRLPVVTGRFVRNDGTPIPACDLAATDRITPDDGTSRTWQKVSVGEDGRFRLVVRYPIPPGGSYLCEIEELTPDGNFRTEVPKIRIDLAPYGAPTDHEIGDVVFDYGPLLVAGKIQDQFGNPIEDAKIMIMERQSVHGFGSFPGCTLARTPGGGFRVHFDRGRELPKNELRLYPRHPASLPSRDSYPLTIGDTGLTIVLPMGGALVAFVKLEAGRQMPALSATLFDSTGGSTTVMVPPDGKLRVTGLRPGFATLVLTPTGTDAGDSDNTIVRIADIQVPARGVSADPRLQGITLPAWLENLTLTVRNEDGEALEGVVVYTGGGPRPRLAGTTNSKGEIRVLSRPTGLDLSFHAWRYRSLTLCGIREDRSVVLGARLQVKLDIVGLDPDDPLAGRLRVNLRPLDSNKPSSFGFMAHPLEEKRVASAGKIVFEIPHPGKYRLWWNVNREDTGSIVVGSIVQQETPQTILVQDTDALQTFRIEVPMAAIRATAAEKDR